MDGVTHYVTAQWQCRAHSLLVVRLDDKSTCTVALDGPASFRPCGNSLQSGAVLNWTELTARQSVLLTTAQDRRRMDSCRPVG